MHIHPQNITDNPNNNTNFMVWNFKENHELETTFQQLCSLVMVEVKRMILKWPKI